MFSLAYLTNWRKSICKSIRLPLVLAYPHPSVSVPANLTRKSYSSVNGSENEGPVPPVAKKKKHFNHYHGVDYLDEYHWLRDDRHEDTEVLSHLKKENNYSSMMLKNIEPLTETIYQEILNRTVEKTVSRPNIKGGYENYVKQAKDQSYEVYCRRKVDENGSKIGDEEVLLDLNTFTEKQLRLGLLSVSPDQQRVAYSLDTTGEEIFKIFIKNILTGETDLVVYIAKASLFWSNDSQYLFYISMDPSHKKLAAYRHNLSKKNTSDEVLFVEERSKIELDIDLSKSGKYLFLRSSTIDKAEIKYIDIDDPHSKPICFSPMISGRKYSIEHLNDHFVVLTNQHLGKIYTNNILLKSPVYQGISTHDEQDWEEVIPYSESRYIKVLHVVKDHIVLEEISGGYANIRVVDYMPSSENPEGQLIEHPESLFVLSVFPQLLEYNKPEIAYTYSSPITPNSIRKYNPFDRSTTIICEDEVSGGYDPELYAAERIYAENDVPISLLYRKDMFKQDGSNPLHLNAYGSYGINSEPWFKTEIFSLLDRGFVYAIAHVRGGSEKGRQWYEEGRLLNKKNTIRDFTSVAKHLTKLNYTSPNVLSIEGRSAGGLLMGAVINQNPDLYSAAIANVGLFDLVDTMMDPKIAITVGNYPEWGNPNIKEHFDYMMSYSPYDNLPTEPSKFPHMLVTSGFNDHRIQYWSPAKYVAKLRDTLSAPGSSKDAKILQIIDMNAGHYGGSGSKNYYTKKSRDYAFLVASSQNVYPFKW